MTQTHEPPQRMQKTQWHRLLGKHLELLLGDMFWDFFTGLRTTMTVRGETMDNEIASNVLTPEVVMETGKQMRKALLANLTPQETQQLVANNEQIRKQILANTSSDERLAGLTTTELASLLHQTETYLRTHSTDSNH